MVLAVFAATGCRTDFDRRSMYGNTGMHNQFSQFGGPFGGATYDANIGIYLVYNTTSRSSGVPDPIGGPATGGVGGVGGAGGVATPFDGGGATSPNEVPSAGGVVTPYGTTAVGGVAPCVIRRFDVPQNGRGFVSTGQFSNTGMARTIGAFQCTPQSRIATTTKGVYITNTGAAGNLVTYVPLSLTGGTLGSFVLSFDGQIGVIDGGDSDYILAAYAQGSGKEDTMVVIREGSIDNLGRTRPEPLYEVQFPNHSIKDIVIDEDHGMAYIALEVPGGWGKIIAYNIADSDAFSQNHLSAILGRTMSVMPPNTLTRNPMQMNNFGFDLGEGTSVFLTSSAPETIKNFDGLTAARVKDGRIFVIQDIYGADLDPTTREQFQATGMSVEGIDYMGTRSGYLWTTVQNSANQATFPGARPQYTDIAVGDNIFYALAGNSVYYFMGDSSMLLHSGVPRHRSLMMGALNTIEIDNQSNVALITSHRGVKVCHVNGGSLMCGPGSTADLTEEAGAMVLDGRMLPKTFTITNQNVLDMNAQKKDQKNNNE